MRFLFFAYFLFFNVYALKAQSIHGTILDSLLNKPLAYANLSVQNSNYGTSTDSLGNYTFDIKNYSNDTLLISMLGYQSKKIALNRFLETKYELDIHLITANTNLDDVLLIYKKKKYTSAKTLGVKRKKVKYRSSVPIGYERCVFIENVSSKKGKIKSVSFNVKKGESDIYEIHPVYFRIKFYQKNKYSEGPGDALSFYDSILKPTNKNQTIKVQFDNTVIPFLESGIFVGIETINPNPKKLKGSMYVTTPNLVMTYDDEPLTYSSYRGQTWTHLKRKMTWKAFGKTTYFYANPLIDLEVQFEK